MIGSPFFLIEIQYSPLQARGDNIKKEKIMFSLQKITKFCTRQISRIKIVNMKLKVCLEMIINYKNVNTFIYFSLFFALMNMLMPVLTLPCYVFISYGGFHKRPKMFLSCKSSSLFLSIEQKEVSIYD